MVGVFFLPGSGHLRESQWGQELRLLKGYRLSPPKRLRRLPKLRAVYSATGFIASKGMAIAVLAMSRI